MAQIELRGKRGAGIFALVDDGSYEVLSGVKWRFGGSGYAQSEVWYNGKPHGIYMHRVVVGAVRGQQVDHINGDRLDNRRENLRICSQHINTLNFHKKRDGKTSKYIGVCWDKNRSLWYAAMTIHGKNKHLGRYKNEDDARRAYLDAKSAYLSGVDIGKV